MKALFIGGTGTISSACAELALRHGFELTLLNRGATTPSRPAAKDGKEPEVIKADISDEREAARLLNGRKFDVVADFIAFNTGHVERDLRLFAGRTEQYIFISTASAYQKPLSNEIITESTPLANPYWQYSRDKIACEELLVSEYRKSGFPITIVRPSHTYGDKAIPVALHGAAGSWQVVDRILRGKPVIVPGDGLTWWTLTHNTDFAKAFVGLMGNVHAIGEAFHITSDERLTWNSIYGIIGQALGHRATLAHVASETLAGFNPDWWGGLMGDKAHSVAFDNTKIKRAVPGYTAAVRFDQGARRTLKYLLEHSETQRPDPEFDALCDKIVMEMGNHIGDNRTGD
ncbi:MAG: SDR family oxidoreductase [Clostridiales bacterium]|jgi:nucleoside-diphosphate-sugar epimerase|nr:SDR family oxidoreductase [Clostridiales bacterium]